MKISADFLDPGKAVRLAGDVNSLTADGFLDSLEGSEIRRLQQKVRRVLNFLLVCSLATGVVLLLPNEASKASLNSSRASLSSLFDRSQIRLPVSPPPPAAPPPIELDTSPDLDNLTREMLLENNILIAEYLANLEEINALQIELKQILFQIAAGFEKIGCVLVVTSGKEDRTNRSLHETGWAIDIVPDTTGQIAFTNDSEVLKEVVKFLKYLEEQIPELRMVYEGSRSMWAEAGAWSKYPDRGAHAHVEIEQGSPQPDFVARLTAAAGDWRGAQLASAE